MTRIVLAAILLGNLQAAAQAPKRPVEEFATSGGTVRITVIRHASLLIEAPGEAVYVDPAQGDYTGLPPATLILVTHAHGDHLAPALIAKLRPAAATVVAPASAAAKIPGAVVMKNGETKTVLKWRIEAVPMYNLKRGPSAGALYHQKGDGNGYVLTYGGKRFYVAGDTENIPEMRALSNIDVAFLPMNLPYTMAPEEAAEAAKAFRPRIVYPYHCRGADLSAFEKALAGTGIEARIRDWYY
jgi:L-ascorbate metabolism protein UlaG (beta-lactamase superfamily)